MKWKKGGCLFSRDVAVGAFVGFTSWRFIGRDPSTITPHSLSFLSLSTSLSFSRFFVYVQLSKRLVLFIDRERERERGESKKEGFQKFSIKIPSRSSPITPKKNYFHRFIVAFGSKGYLTNIYDNLIVNDWQKSISYKGICWYAIEIRVRDTMALFKTSFVGKLFERHLYENTCFSFYCTSAIVVGIFFLNWNYIFEDNIYSLKKYYLI